MDPVKKSLDHKNDKAEDAVPIYNDGYRLIFDENFDDSPLDPAIWNDQYLASWTPDMAAAKAVYEVKDGNLNLIINEDSQPWNPEFDGSVRTSSVMTGNRTGLHEFEEGLAVRNEIEPFMGFITQYGVFEIRAKMMKSLGNMSAWWFVGIQDTPAQDAEVDVFENALNFGNVITTSLYSHRDPLLAEGHFTYPVQDADIGEEFHTYTFEWTPDSLVFYFDDVETGRFDATITYPMLTILSAYEGYEDWWIKPFDPTAPYPKVFQIDYMKVWKKIPDGYGPVDKLKIVSQDDAAMTVPAGAYSSTQPKLPACLPMSRSATTMARIRSNGSNGKKLTPAIIEKLNKPGTSS